MNLSILLLILISATFAYMCPILPSSFLNPEKVINNFNYYSINFKQFFFKMDGVWYIVKEYASIQQMYADCKYMTMEFDGKHGFKVFTCRKVLGSYDCFYGMLNFENPTTNVGNLTFIDRVDGK